MSESKFWSSPFAEPKRAYRWMCFLGGAGSTNELHPWAVRSVKKPSFSVTNAQHSYIGHNFFFPGRVTWDPVEVTFVDPVTPDISSGLVERLSASGYKLPTNEASAKHSLNKKGTTEAFGAVTIQQIDSQGNPLEEWSLKNAWVERMDFGQLDYTSEELVTVTVSFRYDYATFDASMHEGGFAFTDGNS